MITLLIVVSHWLSSWQISPSFIKYSILIPNAEYLFEEQHKVSQEDRVRTILLFPQLHPLMRYFVILKSIDNHFDFSKTLPMAIHENRDWTQRLSVFRIEVQRTGAVIFLKLLLQPQSLHRYRKRCVPICMIGGLYWEV
jgi:hypothetical protein